MATKKIYPFESALDQLEKLVNKMEGGDLALDESLKIFEEGVKLTRECQQALAQAEQKIKLLTEENGEIFSTNFEADDE